MNPAAWFAGNETQIQSALILALLGYSIALPARYGALSLAGVGFFGIGGFGVGLLSLAGWATPAAILLIVVVAAAIALALSLVLAKIRGLYFAMGTLAFTLLIQSLSESLESVTGGVNGLFGIQLSMTTPLLLVMVALVAVFAWVTNAGSSGRRLRLLQADETLSASLGVDIAHQRRIALVICAVCGAAAGGAQSTNFGVFNPSQVSFGLVVSAVTVMVIGGSAWIGPILGALIVTWLPTWLGFAGQWAGVVQGVIVVILILFLRGGVTGVVVNLFRSMRSRSVSRREVTEVVK